ncbi:hypothetical protein [Albimonas pacifica]|uniref:Protein ImuA n=1 Tax=Albimonas pacifica TaxID=1114924 RepID=A0A1I3H671_9RHOB|nr:hypothetical protein [Albimonas pacifica]SFI31216.1 protein ImuA [Albimonas pacifica]
MSRDPLRALLGAERRPRPALSLAEPREGAAGAEAAALALGRAHEVCGPSAAVFAAMAAARLAAQAGPGPVLWIRGPRAEGATNPDGLARFLDPARLVLATPRRPEDALWCAEEALRAGAAGLAVVELPAPPGLTPVRRLHLAAEAGAAPAAGQGAPPPLALLLTPDPGGAQGVETRWRMSPAASRPGPGGRPEPCWRLELLRARMVRPRRWLVAWTEGAPHGALDLQPEPPAARRSGLVSA